MGEDLTTYDALFKQNRRLQKRLEASHSALDSFRQLHEAQIEELSASHEHWQQAVEERDHIIHELRERLESLAAARHEETLQDLEPIRPPILDSSTDDEENADTLQARRTSVQSRHLHARALAIDLARELEVCREDYADLRERSGLRISHLEDQLESQLRFNKELVSELESLREALPLDDEENEAGDTEPYQASVDLLPDKVKMQLDRLRDLDVRSEARVEDHIDSSEDSSPKIHLLLDGLQQQIASLEVACQEIAVSRKQNPSELKSGDASGNA